MSMIYLHVPFCTSRCIYCDFYSTTQSATVRHEYVNAACAELANRKSYLADRLIQSIYFGGGTPSQLQIKEIAILLDSINKHYDIDTNAEITLEANPDDVTPDFAHNLRNLGFNRVSLGVQSFNDRILKMLNRRHDAATAQDAVHTLQQAGLDNISIDLIYGLPTQLLQDFSSDLQKAFSLPIKHLSTYALSIEQGTLLQRKIQSNELAETDEDTFIAEYEIMMQQAHAHGFEHYEISNFALPGFESRHNSGYWNNTPYLGIGPGAHSFNGTDERQYNEPNLGKYISATGLPPHTIEHLTLSDQFDEQIFTSLRTRKGLSLNNLEKRFDKAWLEDLKRAAQKHISSGNLTFNDYTLCLTRKGIMTSNDIISDLMRAE